jgi:hypothetical protein
MESLAKIKELVELMSIEANKVFDKRNRSASIRARKYAQEIKILCGEFRKEILAEIQKQDGTTTN